MEALWSAALPLLRQHVGDGNFAAWLEPLRALGADGEVRLEVPSRFFQSWVTRHFLSTIRDTMSELSGAPCAVRVVVAEAPSPERRTAPADASPSAPEPSRPARVPKIGRLVPHYTFETFVVGAANEVAFRAAQAVSAAPGKRFNPVFLHGGVGLGKTHLVNAIAHELLGRRARMQIACLA